MSLVVPMSGNNIIFAGTLTDTEEFPVSARGRLLSVFATGTAGNSASVYGGVRNAAGALEWEWLATVTVGAGNTMDSAQLVDFGHPFLKVENVSGTPRITMTWSN